MREIEMHDEELEPLTEILAKLTGVPDDRLAGFAVMVAVFEEDGKPTGRLISSTPNLRTLASMMDLAREKIGEELDKLAGQS